MYGVKKSLLNAVMIRNQLRVSVREVIRYANYLIAPKYRNNDTWSVSPTELFRRTQKSIKSQHSYKLVGISENSYIKLLEINGSDLRFMYSNNIFSSNDEYIMFDIPLVIHILREYGATEKHIEKVLNDVRMCYTSKHLLYECKYDIFDNKNLLDTNKPYEKRVSEVPTKRLIGLSDLQCVEIRGKKIIRATSKTLTLEDNTEINIHGAVTLGRY